MTTAAPQVKPRNAMYEATPAIKPNFIIRFFLFFINLFRSIPPQKAQDSNILVKHVFKNLNEKPIKATIISPPPKGAPVTATTTQVDRAEEAVPTQVVTPEMLLPPTQQKTIAIVRMISSTAVQHIFQQHIKDALVGIEKNMRLSEEKKLSMSKYIEELVGAAGASKTLYARLQPHVTPHQGSIDKWTSKLLEFMFTNVELDITKISQKVGSQKIELAQGIFARMKRGEFNNLEGDEKLGDVVEAVITYVIVEKANRVYSTYDQHVAAEFSTYMEELIIKNAENVTNNIAARLATTLSKMDFGKLFDETILNVKDHLEIVSKVHSACVTFNNTLNAWEAKPEDHQENLEKFYGMTLTQFNEHPYKEALKEQKLKEFSLNVASILVKRKEFEIQIERYKKETQNEEALQKLNAIYGGNDYKLLAPAYIKRFEDHYFEEHYSKETTSDTLKSLKFIEKAMNDEDIIEIGQDIISGVLDILIPSTTEGADAFEEVLKTLKLPPALKDIFKTFKENFIQATPEMVGKLGINNIQASWNEFKKQAKPKLPIVRSFVLDMLNSNLSAQVLTFIEKVSKPQFLDMLMAENILPVINESIIQTIMKSDLAKLKENHEDIMIVARTLQLDEINKQLKGHHNRNQLLAKAYENPETDLEKAIHLFIGDLNPRTQITEVNKRLSHKFEGINEAFERVVTILKNSPTKNCPNYHLSDEQIELMCEGVLNDLTNAITEHEIKMGQQIESHQLEATLKTSIVLQEKDLKSEYGEIAGYLAELTDLGNAATGAIGYFEKTIVKTLSEAVHPFSSSKTKLLDLIIEAVHKKFSEKGFLQDVLFKEEFSFTPEQITEEMRSQDPGEMGFKYESVFESKTALHKNHFKALAEKEVDNQVRAEATGVTEISGKDKASIASKVEQDQNAIDLQYLNRIDPVLRDAFAALQAQSKTKVLPELIKKAEAEHLRHLSRDQAELHLTHYKVTSTTIYNSRVESVRVRILEEEKQRGLLEYRREKALESLRARAEAGKIKVISEKLDAGWTSLAEVIFSKVDHVVDNSGLLARWGGWLGRKVTSTAGYDSKFLATILKDGYKRVTGVEEITNILIHRVVENAVTHAKAARNA